MLSTEAQSLLRRIRADVSAGHWIKGRAADGLGNFCLSGHLTRQGAGNYDAHIEAHWAVVEAIRARGYLSIPSFNDNLDTRREDIIDIIDEASKR